MIKKEPCERDFFYLTKLSAIANTNLSSKKYKKKYLVMYRDVTKHQKTNDWFLMLEQGT